jgi:oligopeptide/dipeptide ABC transporter ATP-binding protein
MRETHGAAVVLITHDLGVVARMADRVAVMYAGRIVEQGTVRDLFHRPQHPYTWGLLESIPRIDRERIARLHSIAGQPPSLIGLDEGCSFRVRCAFAHARCDEAPPLEQRFGAPGHLDACWLDSATKLRRGTHSAAS